MRLSIRELNRLELPGFCPYLLPETTAELKRKTSELIAVGAVTGRNACGAAAAYVTETGIAELTDLFVDETVRRQGVGGFLLDALLKRVRDAGVWQIKASYVLSGEELPVMDHLLTNRGFERMETRSHVFAVSSAKHHDNRFLSGAFSTQYHTPPDIRSLSDVPEDALIEMERFAAVHLHRNSLRERFLPELSVALFQHGRVEAYLLAEGSADGGYVLLAAASRKGAPATAFLRLLKELVNRCYYRSGGDFLLYFSISAPRVERLALRLMGEQYICYEEHACVWRKNQTEKTRNADKEGR